jgi:GNAT superfamily N-acetyltransferase
MAIVNFRAAQTYDIQQIQTVRNAVKENMLSDPALVTDKGCEEFLTVRGKGWVCEVDGNVVGFSIADLTENNIWALLVHPDYEAIGIGKRLHKEMLDWYFNQTKEKIWLGTAPNTGAEKFYRLNGWTETGIHGKDEIKFELTFEEWMLAGNYHKIIT